MQLRFLALLFAIAQAIQARESCIAATTASDINKRLKRRGEGARLLLCPQALISVDESIVFTAAHQSIATYGLATGQERAVLQLLDGLDEKEAALSTLIDARIGGRITGLRLDGGRGVFGAIPSGGAVIEAGGHSTEIMDVEIFEPRGQAAIRLSGKLSPKHTHGLAEFK